MISKTTFLAALAAGLAGIAGCSTQSLPQVGTAPRQAISYAATAKYPGNPTTSPNVHAAAVVDRDANELTIYNLSDTGIPGSTVWVNGAFVHMIPPIGPRSSQRVDFAQLLQAGEGVQSLKMLAQPVRKVELQTAEGLFSVEGPANR